MAILNLAILTSVDGDKNRSKTGMMMMMGRP